MERSLCKVPPKAHRRVLCRETLLKARRCLEENCLLEAEFLYMEGMLMLRELIREEPILPKRAQYNREQRENEQILRSLQNHIQRHMKNCKLSARYTLRDGERGHSYSTLFSPYMDEQVLEMHIYEPNLCTRSHYKNLINFLEVCLKQCTKLKYVRVFTRCDAKNSKYQMSALKTIGSDILNASMTFNFRFRQGMTERKIVLGNGFIIKTNHGLHLYQQTENNLLLGTCDYDYRKCHQTEVDVWHSNKPFFETATENHLGSPCKQMAEEAC